MTSETTLRTRLIQRTLRVARAGGPGGDSSPVARQLDIALMSAGFKASRELVEHVSSLAKEQAVSLSTGVVVAVRALVGDQVAHNPYFRRFPRGVPDTVEFWLRELRSAAGSGEQPEVRFGVINLLSLPRYGRVQHTYEEMLAEHDELLPSIKDRVTVVHLGGDLDEEITTTFLALAGSTTPLESSDLQLFATLAALRVDLVPESIPVRETRGVLNAARLAAGLPLVAVDTVVDVLRVACQASGGDVTLLEPTRFRGFRRAERRVLMGALDQVIAGNEGKLGDVNRYAGRFKRLGERLHPHEYPAFPHAQDVFAVARGERVARTMAGRAEVALAAGEVAQAARVLAAAPGLLFRSLDRLLRSASGPEEAGKVLATAGSVVASVSGRVLCSVREHLGNRTQHDFARLFVNRSGRPWITADTRRRLAPEVVYSATTMLDEELLRRLPAYDRLVVDPEVLPVALPLSGKATADGLDVLPRGTRTPVDGDLLRFFTYWRQSKQRTDYDLSVSLLDENFDLQDQVSWTNYHADGAVYSGDLTDAPDGATEFIDLPLRAVSARYVVPQVDIYSGEGFTEVVESMFGWMVRDGEQQGAPFEPRTVRMRSELRGTGRVALPVMFERDYEGKWTAIWLHVYLSGSPKFNQVAATTSTVGTVAATISRRHYLTVEHVVDMLAGKAGSVTTWAPGLRLDGPVTFIGLHRPDGLPEGSTAITLDRLSDLVPN
ncbi:hypothetical protein [Actinokineospora globicatena]|uniref:TerD family protein n=1 Tax=Actinokineospora globicatena TaxID=103729 RepID=A0A9W6V8N2_9PSEU|nr:hypothetical protein [Actinokineospora globicatena]GLW90108.1 hypothetical protein Aglo03_09240 [Actinokineospora globicatena]